VAKAALESESGLFFSLDFRIGGAYHAYVKLTVMEFTGSATIVHIA
jgi:hypothetical protein